ncbi:uncharacterized protein LOC132917734 [Rhopalosiphum padi]|uniref:uncharacterized protein LOC132917734 n=1 Tax=Rhopalosiphum padi TaxID=40932 RepID=UPI00298E834E|nr:uncharacterized protein LOC132917734 [Rhopalosiphum padi]
MKNCIFFLVIQLIFTVNLESTKSPDVKIYSTSPIGPYELSLKRVYNCNPTQDNKIQHNYYLSHVDNKTMILGNTTSYIPFDDTLLLEVKMSLKDSNGRWRENSFFQKWPKACSTFKQSLGKAWPVFSKGLGLINTNCPIPPGIYINPGADASLFKKSNLPKTFLYGTYKFNMYYSRKNEIFGCQIYIIEFTRP